MPESKLSKAFNSILNRIKGKRAVSLKNADLLFPQVDRLSEFSAKDAKLVVPFESEKLIVKN